MNVCSEGKTCCQCQLTLKIMMVWKKIEQVLELRGKKIRHQLRFQCHCYNFDSKKFAYRTYLSHVNGWCSLICIVCEDIRSMCLDPVIKASLSSSTYDSSYHYIASFAWLCLSPVAASTLSEQLNRLNIVAKKKSSKINSYSFMDMMSKSLTDDRSSWITRVFSEIMLWVRWTETILQNRCEGDD